MTVFVVGLGSMGRRRIRLLQQLNNNIYIVGIDTQDKRRKQTEDEFGITTEPDIETAYHNRRGVVDAVFVSTAPLSHAEIIQECLNHNAHVFTEINLTDRGYSENARLAKERGKVLFLSSTLMYRKEIQFIKDEVQRNHGQVNYMYHVGQYLPDWHPWENYKDFFVGTKETNGCRELMAIEFPWITDTFGEINKIHSIKRKITTLDIDYPDSYQVLFEHESGHRGMISIDIVSRKAVRNLEIWSENTYLTWDGSPYGLKKYDYEKKIEETISLYETIDKRKEYSSTIIEDAYLSEIVDFMKAIKGESRPRYSFEKDKETLKIINSIEEDVS